MSKVVTLIFSQKRTSSDFRILTNQPLMLVLPTYDNELTITLPTGPWTKQAKNRLVMNGLPIEDGPWSAIATLLILLVDCLAAAAMTPNGIDTLVAALSQDNVDERTIYIAHMIAVEIARNTMKMINNDLPFPKELYTKENTKKTNKKLTRVTINILFKEICQVIAKNATMVDAADVISPAAYAKSFFLRLYYVALYGKVPDLGNNEKEDTEVEEEFLSGKDITEVEVQFAGNLKSTCKNVLQSILLAYPSFVRETYATQKELFDLKKTLCYDPASGHPYTEEIYKSEFVKYKPKRADWNGVTVEAALTTVGVIKYNGPLDVDGSGLVKGMITKNLSITTAIEELQSDSPTIGFRPQFDYLCDNFLIDKKEVTRKRKTTPKKNASPTLKQTATTMTTKVGDILENIKKNREDDPKKCLDEAFTKLTELHKMGEECLKIGERSPTTKRKTADDNNGASDGNKDDSANQKKKAKKAEDEEEKTEDGKPKDANNEDADKDTSKKRSANRKKH